MQVHPAPVWISYIITAVIVGLVLLLRMRGMRRATRLRLGQLWLVPAVYALVAAGILYEFPPRGLTWAWLGLALLVGAGIGWWRGMMMRITVDPATGTLNQQSSPAAFLFIVLILIARQGLRYEAASMGINVMTMTDLLVAFALGLFTATRAEMYLRAKRLLGEARAF